jgi:hypothetical protein
LIEEATGDCYNDDEQVTSLYTRLDEHLELPFETTVLGISVIVDAIDLRDTGDIIARCSKDGSRQSISLDDLPLPTPPPQGVEWVEAYRLWTRQRGRHG